MCSLKESSVVQKHLSQQGYLCSPGAGIITIIIHIDFTDGIYWLFWNRDRIQCHPEIFLWELFCLKKTPVSPKMTFIEKGSLRLVLVGLRKVLPEISHKRNLLFWIFFFCLFYYSENCSEFVLKKHIEHQTKHTYRQYLSWFQVGVIFFPYKTFKTNHLKQMKRED